MADGCDFCNKSRVSHSVQRSQQRWIIENNRAEAIDGDGRRERMKEGTRRMAATWTKQNHTKDQSDQVARR